MEKDLKVTHKQINDTQPVSYTHLDVYKRQLQDSAVRRNIKNSEFDKEWGN